MAQPAIPVLEAFGSEMPQARDERVAVVTCSDAPSRLWSRRWLEAVGFSVEVADNADAALALSARCRPAVFVVEAALRDNAGRRVIESLRDRFAAAPVPTLVLASSDREVREVLAAGFSEVLRRPFDWQLVAARAQDAVAQSRAKAELSELRAEVEQLRQAVEEARREEERHLNRDSVTGLATRARFERAVEVALARGVRDRFDLVALCDLGPLRSIRARVGRGGATSVLQQFAQRLVAGLRSDEILRTTAGSSLSAVARLGSGSFGILLTGFRSAPAASAAIRSLYELLATPYSTTCGDHTLRVGIGVAMAPLDGSSTEELIDKAELALEETADSSGVAFYQAHNHRASARAGEVERHLAGALVRDEFHLVYQPLVDGSTWRVCAAEALLRWRSPELGDVTPGEFVPLAEETGLMVSIGGWVLRTACRQLRSWLDAGMAPVQMAVNVSLCQLTPGNLPSLVAECLAESGIEPSLLQLELSERGVLRSDPEIVQQLRDIRALGVRLAIDDFGTGNSAFGYLKRFPIDTLKIDRSFVSGVARSNEDAAITTATIAIASRLGLRVVAEGVEGQEQVDFLEAWGCREYQGFLFSPGVAPEEFLRLAASSCRPTQPA